MTDKETEDKSEGLDLLGIGKTAKAIPDETYNKVTKELIERFNEIISPITEATSGLGRFIRQKFDNMVEAEKAISAYTMDKAIKKAQKKSKIAPPNHVKSFINSFEEASKETDKTLHEMWTNILANQLIESDFHPHYVNILSHFSAEEAELLLKLKPYEEIGQDLANSLGFSVDSFNYYILKNYDKELHEWTYSCKLLVEFGFADILVPIPGIYPENKKVVLIYKTYSGEKLLNAVTVE